MKKNQIIKYVFLALAIAVNIFILVNGFIDGTTSGKESGAVAKVVEDVVNTIQPGTVTDSTRPAFIIFTRKFIGHFCLFGLSGILSTLSFNLFLKNTKLHNILIHGGLSAVFGFVIALISELNQLVAEDRVFSMKDVSIDFMGYFLGLLFIIILLILIEVLLKNPGEKKQAE